MIRATSSGPASQHGLLDLGQQPRAEGDRVVTVGCPERVGVADVADLDRGRSEVVLELGDAGERQRPESDAVVGDLAGDGLAALRLTEREVVLPDELPGRLHRLGAAAGEVDAVVVCRGQGRHLLGQLQGGRVSGGPVGVERQRGQLPGGDLGHLGAVRVADLRAEQTGEGVDVLPAGGVVDVRSLGSLQHQQVGDLGLGEVQQQVVAGHRLVVGHDAPLSIRQAVTGSFVDPASICLRRLQPPPSTAIDGRGRMRRGNRTRGNHPDDLDRRQGVHARQARGVRPGRRVRAAPRSSASRSCSTVPTSGSPRTRSTTTSPNRPTVRSSSASPHWPRSCRW